MISGFESYPAMKESGVSWLGKVPEHWHVSPAFAVYRPRQVKNTGMVESTVLSLSYGRIIVKAPEKLRGLVPESFETYQIVEPGNIIVRTTDLQNDQRSVRIGHAHHRGIITAAYLCLESTSIVLNEFGYQYLKAYDLLKIIYGFGSGLRQSLDFHDIKRMPVLVPPKEEQAAIVRFLDHADRRIRRYVHAKQKLIKLLEEQKRAIIHRAVTLGLDRNVRLKPSGVEWLGDVPEHWEVKPVGALCSYISYGFTNPMPAADDGPYMLTANDIGHGAIRYETARHTSQAAYDQFLTRKSRPKAGDVLVTKDGTLGRVAVADGSLVCINQSVALLRPDPSEILPEYLAAALQGPLYQERMVLDAGGTTIKHIYITRLSKMRLAYPSVREQKSILNSLSDGLAANYAAVSAAKRQVELLREYGTRLIADVVTGKLDVREATARLPDEIDEVGPLDEFEAEGEGDEAGADDTGEAPEELEA